MQDLPISNWKNKRRFKSSVCQLAVLFGVAVTHAFLISLFTQKYGAQRHLHSDSTTARKVFSIRLLADRRLTPKMPDSEAPLIAPTIPPQDQASPPPDLEPEKSNSLLGQDTPEQAAFITTKQLTEKPQVQVDINPDIAMRLATNKNRVAILRLRINELGDIDQVLFEHGDFSEAEIEFLTTACKAMKFAPGKLGKIPVKSEMRIEMTIEALNLIAPPIKSN
jgi:hypothetical protein